MSAANVIPWSHAGLDTCLPEIDSDTVAGAVRAPLRLPMSPVVLLPVEKAPKSHAVETIPLAIRDRVLARIAHHYFVTVEAILGRGRGLEISEARQMTMAVFLVGGWSMSAVGRALHRDHSTVLHGVARVKADPERILTRDCLLAEVGLHCCGDPYPPIRWMLRWLAPHDQASILAFIHAHCLSGSAPRRDKSAYYLHGLFAMAERPDLTAKVADLLSAHQQAGAAYTLVRTVAEVSRRRA